MASKQLESIIATMPSATAKESDKQNFINTKVSDVIEFKKKQKNDFIKIVATASKDVKEELKKMAKNMQVTETVIILKALKNFGLQSIDDSMLVDRRTLR